jgi:hypothetical protein
MDGRGSQEHRQIEAALDVAGESVLAGVVDIEAFRRIHRMCVTYYEHEEAFLARLEKQNAALADKLRGQHAEALEIAERMEETARDGHGGDMVYLARRFMAIVQHNITEEERDVWPVVG